MSHSATSQPRLKDAMRLLPGGVAVIVERGAAPAIEAAGLPYVAAYALADLGLG